MSSLSSVNVIGDFAEVWRKLLHKLSTYGNVVSPRDIATRELIGVQLHIEDYSKNIIVSPDRNLNYKFMIAEWLWIHEGRNDLFSIALFNKKYLDLSDDGVTLFGAYGPHWIEQRDYIVRTLKRDPFSRQAIISLWKTNPPITKDMPCTLTIQFLHRDGVLHMVVNMRSSDVWLGIPYDVFTFSQLGNWVAAQLGYIRGDLIMQLGSSHIYETDMEKAQPILRVNGIPGVMRSPSLVLPEGEGYPESILIPPVSGFPAGLPEPWRSYAEILGSPRTEAYKILEAAT